MSVLVVVYIPYSPPNDDDSSENDGGDSNEDVKQTSQTKLSDAASNGLGVQSSEKIDKNLADSAVTETAEPFTLTSESESLLDNDTDTKSITFDTESSPSKSKQTTLSVDLPSSPIQKAKSTGQLLKLFSTVPDPVQNKHESLSKSLSDGFRVIERSESTPLSVHFDIGANDVIPMETEEFTLAQAVHLKLEELGVTTDIWSQTGEWDGLKDYWQVTFILENEQCDNILKALTTLGIGRIEGTSISLFPANYYEARHEKKQVDKSIEKKKSQFMKSIKSRLMVAQVVESVRLNSELTFDFLLFVCLASMIAGVGLADNSTVSIVASMLVSPIMGPILGGTFGLVVGHKSTCRLGVRNELISLTLCIFNGFLLGLIMAGVNVNGSKWGATDAWPTPEMKGRGQLRGLWVGVLIATPSGAGVALSVLSGNMGSLVGVAISASLLPPAVNAGILWAYALVTAFKPPAIAEDSLITPSAVYTVDQNGTVTYLTDVPVLSPPNCPSLKDNEYEFIYSCDMNKEAAILGMVSLLLTLVNIFCIFITSIIVLSIKKVVPDKMVPEYARSFWKSDIQIARQAYKTYKPAHNTTAYTAQLAKEMAKEFKHEIFPEKENKVVKESWHEMMQDMQTKNNTNAMMDNLVGSPVRLLEKFSAVGEEVLEEEEDRKYHTVSGMTEHMKMEALEPEVDHVQTTLKKGVVRSRSGRQTIFYNQKTLDRRQHRMTWHEHGMTLDRMSSPAMVAAVTQSGLPSYAEQIRRPSFQIGANSSPAMPRLPSSLSTVSGRKFQITPVTETDAKF